MTTSFENLLASKYLENTQTAQYTSSSVKTIIDHCTVINTSASNEQLNVNIVVNGGSASSSNLVINDLTIEPNKTYQCPELVGLTLSSGDFISTLASASNALSINISGRIIS